MTSFLQRLDDRDLVILGERTGASGSPDDLRRGFERRPWDLIERLARPEMIDLVFDPRAGIEQVHSPGLMFGIVVAAAAEQMRSVDYTSEWAGPGHRVPLWETESVTEFLESPARTLYLADLLAEFAAPVQPGAGFEGRARLVDMVPPSARGVVLKSLGDLALFRAGILPDAVGRNPLRPDQVGELAGSAGLGLGDLLAAAGASGSPVDMLEVLGSGWYRRAVDEGAHHKVPTVLNDLAARFRAARRILNAVADRFLFRIRTAW